MKCETCGIDVRGVEKASHTRGVFHRQAERIRALLAKPCITYAEIGKRIGVTRERIRQIHNTILAGDGMTRREECKLSKPPKPPVLPSHTSVIMRFRSVCEGRNISFSFINVKRRGKGYSVYLRKATVNGKTCSFGQACMHRGFTHIRRPNHPGEITIYLLPDGNWMMLPLDKLPKNSTSFSEMPNRDGVGITKFARHDWTDYIDNWRILA